MCVFSHDQLKLELWIPVSFLFQEGLQVIEKALQLFQL